LISFLLFFRTFQERLVACELTLGLRELNLKRTFVDFSQQIALLDELPFSECDLNELAIDTATDCHYVGCGDSAQPTQVDRHIHFTRRNSYNRRTASATTASTSSSAPPTGIIGTLGRG
jgi:hypothetical protein